MTRSEILEQLAQRFHQGLHIALGGKARCEALGIDPKRADVQVGYNSGRFPHSSSVTDKEREVYRDMGLTIHSEKTGKCLKVWGKEKLVFALRNRKGSVVNFFAHSDEATAKGEYLNDEGLYPCYPDSEVKKLILGYTITQTARLISQGNEYQTSIAYLALQEGQLTQKHMEAMGALTSLETIEAPLEMLTDSELTDLENWMRQNMPQVTLKALSDSKEPMIPELHTVPDEQAESESTEPADTDSAIVIEVVGGIERIDPNQYQRLEVTLRIWHKQMPRRIYRNSLDLYHFQTLMQVVEEASSYIGCMPEDVQGELDTVILDIENSVAQRKDDHTCEEASLNAKGSHHGLTDTQFEKALELARDPKLTDTVYSELLSNIGIVNEEDNRMVCFLVSVSRKLDKPLHLINVGSSGTGKSHLLETIGKTLPKEEFLELTSISEKALFNINGSLSGKVIMIQDMFDVSEEVQYQLRELQSKGKLTRSVTQKQKNGNYTTIYQETLGPVSVMASTTDDRLIYADNSNRNIVITQDESADQDQAILNRQKKLASKSIDLAREAQSIQQLQKLQSILKSYPIKNPYANDLELPAFVERKRRTMAIYLGLIEAVTLLNQYQRRLEIINGTEYLITDIKDIAWANRLIEPILLYKSDLLGNASRRFFESLKTWSSDMKIETFSTKEIARGLRVKANTIKSHIRQLRSYGLLKVTSGDRYKQGFRYEISEHTEYEHLKKHVAKTLTGTLKRIEVKYGKVA